MTEPGTMLGTIDYMAPEQAKDARAVDIRADIYALGGTLFWCLTGKTPFSHAESTLEGLMRRQTQTPPSVRSLRSEVPEELAAVLARMMAPCPADRYPTPQAVMAALLPFIKQDPLDCLDLVPRFAVNNKAQNSVSEGTERVQQVLIVDDESAIRHLCRFTLEGATIQCD